MSTRVGTVVIGAGPMGASAARHLAGMPDAGSVMVIGPDAPVSTHAHAGVHGAWHDEARLTRIIANDHVWATLAAESIARYPQIEAAGGIPFHRTQGVLYVHETAESFALQHQVATDLSVEFDDISAEPHRVPFLRLTDGAGLLLEGGGAGTVNPKALVANQLRGAERLGAAVLRHTAIAVDETSSGVVVRTREGATVEADRVLVAAGAYLNSFPFFPSPLPVVSTGITALFFEVAGDVAAALQGMPGILWYPPAGGSHFLYSVPPTQYPDGKVYFKIGGYRESGPLLHEADITEWHRTDGGRMEVEMLKAFVAEHIPVLAGHDAHAIGCVITDTDSAMPMLREVVPGRISVATGCAGAAAKSCDEIGRLAALVATGANWDSSLPKTVFHG